MGTRYVPTVYQPADDVEEAREVRTFRRRRDAIDHLLDQLTRLAVREDLSLRSSDGLLELVDPTSGRPRYEGRIREFT